MRLLIIGLLLCTVSCGTQKEVVTESTENEIKKGTVIELARKTREGLSDDKDLYFRMGGRNFFIKLTDSDVQLKELRKHIDKEICVVGEVKNGPWNETGAATLSQPAQKERAGLYIAIKDIVKCP